MTNLKTTVIEGAARALFVQAWADACSCGNDYQSCSDEDTDAGYDPDLEHEANDPGQCELMDVAPDTPRDALLEGAAFIGALEQANGSNIEALANRATDADIKAGNLEKGDEIDPSDFGHYLAMEGLGHGVAWTDSHAEFSVYAIRGDKPLALPHVEYHAWDAMDAIKGES